MTCLNNGVELTRLSRGVPLPLLILSIPLIITLMISKPIEHQTDAEIHPTLYPDYNIINLVLPRSFHIFIYANTYVHILVNSVVTFFAITTNHLTLSIDL
jgi:hypothetical protein